MFCWNKLAARATMAHKSTAHETRAPGPYYRRWRRKRRSVVVSSFLPITCKRLQRPASWRLICFAVALLAFLLSCTAGRNASVFATTVFIAFVREVLSKGLPLTVHVTAVQCTSISTMLLLSLMRFVVSVELVDTTLYGGLFESGSTIAYAEVVQTCFGGMQVGSCEPTSPNWLKDFLDQYNGGDTGAYCASCCSNSDTVGDTWAFDCELVSVTFADFVNKFGWEFRFGRREASFDTSVVTCPIPRTACFYNEDGSLAADCESDGSYLVSYVLTIETMTVEKGLSTWKSVQGCSVEVEETDEVPSSLSETLVMTQVYGEGSAIEVGWAFLITFVALAVCSCCVRFARDECCMICGHHLIYLQKVCILCRFYGYDPPSKDVLEIIKDKRSVVLPEPSVTERLGTMKTTTTKVFVQATESLRSTVFDSHGSMRVARAPQADTEKTEREYRSSTGEGGGRGARESGYMGSHIGKMDVDGTVQGLGAAPEGVRTPGIETERGNATGWLSAISSARSVTFADDIHRPTGETKASPKKGGKSGTGLAREAAEGEALRKNPLCQS